MGAGRTGFGGEADISLGSGIDRGGGGDGWDGYKDRLSRWEDNVAHVNLGTEPNAPLVYALALELPHTIMSKVGEHEEQLERKRERALHR